MLREKRRNILWGTLTIVALAMLVGCLAVKKKTASKKIGEHQQQIAYLKKKNKKKTVKPKPFSEKSKEAKQATMDADFAQMNALGLYYDYHTLSLVDTVKAYLEEFGIDESQIAFSYKDLRSGKTVTMNEHQPMTAGSTYKLPLNMLVVDEVKKGKLTLTERFDITGTDYEYEQEHNAYVAQFSGAMSIPDMQEYSLVYSENTPAYALAECLGGMNKAYQLFDRYGKASGPIPTIDRKGNKTTTAYYLQVLDYLWKHQDKYEDILYFIGESFPDLYYKAYLPNITIYQKPGYVREALNIGAIVCEESPYLIALYSAGLGGATEESEEVNGLGYVQLINLTYVINEWHRVNHNMT
ncbi:serine hydrolase [Streptococcus dysgalactiae subsp. equisimilis]|uniref:serine hydrolase n=1 Tax=Streptococcus dysgalactiae TaxID=1334 RepID=UPI000806FE55|nr:serine hydrolase [Streptococcus dysgalactiae]OBZ00375.1 serine hydrolase [Streptococcus dysgalactiae subsp. equisimilis]